MKKSVLSLIVGAAITIAPMTASALSPMTTDNLKDATGQAGVSIALDDITLYQTVGEKMYIDTDGDSVAGNDIAAIIISGKETLTTIRAIADHSDRGGFLQDAMSGVGYAEILQGNVGNRSDTYIGIDGDTLGQEIKIAALSIDVSSACPVSTKLNDDNDTATTDDVAGVIIGLPTIEICKTGDTQDIGIVACDENGEKGGNVTKNFIRITKEDSVMAILGGTLEIAPH
ncbi:DUF6160 family protein [Desulfoluna sp.]|uniref:DUF6160 family protein n=1 Tax=Desulfoluna sp. TaxID=2045199 RepID=UPI0026250534|nr:DUF6160 family protein [Desulfoluna sp.]